MKNSIYAWLVIGMTALSVYASEDNTIKAKGELSFATKDIWRGFTLNDDWNTQPEFSIEINGVKLGYWGSFHWDNESTQYNQHDVYIGYDWTYPETVLDFSVGYTYYKFPLAMEGQGETHEFWFGAGLDIFLKPTLKLYVDVGDKEKGGGDGEYLVASLSHEQKLTDEVALLLDGSLGYNYKQYIEENGFADVVPSASIVWALTDRVSLKCKLSYSYLLENKIKEAMNSDNEFIALFSLSVN
jgi:hypothetical protein